MLRLTEPRLVHLGKWNRKLATMVPACASEQLCSIEFMMDSGTRQHCWNTCSATTRDERDPVPLGAPMQRSVLAWMTPLRHGREHLP